MNPTPMTKIDYAKQLIEALNRQKNEEREMLWHLQFEAETEAVTA